MPYPTQAGTADPTAMGAMDEQARKRLVYERYLDHIAGFAPGESELSDEEIMRRRQLQAQGQPQGYPRNQGGMPSPGYAPGAPGRQPMQAGGGQVPFEAILAQLKARPGMVEHLEGIDLDGDGVPDIPFQPSPQMMADPMGRMQWQAMLQNRQRMMQGAQQRRAQRKEVNNQVLLATLQANDPLFDPTYNRLCSYVQQLPHKVRQPYLSAVHRTPGAFLDLYTHIRDGVVRALQRSVRTTTPMPQPASDDPRARIRQAVAGRMSAPALENAGIMDDRLPGATRAAERAALIKRVKSGGAREGDLLKYLELSGL
ncbi:hypothetical protein [Fundidesulfovibrio putealis]|uniref:hypothetical protein n=1 Tax=Fundidesulfovibrio putealis TaxID=270496 RepID=UPI0003F768AF|nr:hypothetical protein [Fundidesulfovibrio putealis]